jgi:hypothetical protein
MIDNKRPGAVIRKRRDGPSVSDPINVTIPAGATYETKTRLRPDGSGYVEIVNVRKADG